ncbi:MAG TPA: tetratricopeptide repeat protein [Candidatus Limnocylindrales bacterium]|nr:tetratricopeptide repeat protein [Candidatus Limnocylindrales bacterium]
MPVPGNQPPTAQGQEPSGEFDARLIALFAKWEHNELPARETQAQIEAMSREAQADGHAANQGRAELLLGVLQGYRANLDASIRHFERARALFEQAGNRARAIGCILNLGECYRLQGNFTRARQLFRAASEAAREIRDVDTEAIALCNEGQMLLSMGQPESAHASLTHAAEVAVDIPLQKDREELQCEIQYALAGVLLRMKDVPGAWQHALASRALAQQHRDQPLLTGLANRGMGEVLTALGRLPPGSDPALSPDPDRYFEDSIEAFKAIKADGETARSMYAHAVSLSARGEGAQAARKLQQAMILFTRLGMADDAAKAAQAQMKALSSPSHTPPSPDTKTS